MVLTEECSMRNSNAWKQLNEAMASVTARVQASIVQVHNARHGGGTGLVIQSDGLIVTNAHVVRHRYPHVTLADGRRLRAQVLGYDEHEDLTALAVEATGLPALAMADARAARPGEVVQAVGHPWGRIGAATAGVLLDVDAAWLGPHLRGRDWLVADLHLQPGNSGGPLVDVDGRVLGVNTMLIGGLGVAIPVHRVRAFLRHTRAAGAAATV